MREVSASVLARTRFPSQGSDAVAEVKFQRARGLEPLCEQGGRAGLDRIRADQLVKPPGVGANRVRFGQVRSLSTRLVDRTALPIRRQDLPPA
jgi:hypothetical protein